MDYKIKVNEIIKDTDLWRKYNLDDELISRIDSRIRRINKEGNHNKNKKGNCAKNKKEPLNKEVMNGLLYRLNIEKAKHNESIMLSALISVPSNTIALLTLLVTTNIFSPFCATVILAITFLGCLGYLLYWKKKIVLLKNKIYLIESRIKELINEENMQ